MSVTPALAKLSIIKDCLAIKWTGECDSDFV